jgi:Flp pilus assembly protein TadD
MSRLDDLTKRYPKFSEGFSFKGIICEQRKQPREARAFYEEALRLDSHNAVAANNLAWLLAVSFEEPQDGLELARTAHRLDPGNADYSDTLGWIQYLLGNYAAAMESLGDAVRLRPDDGGLRYHLGMAQRRAGRNQEARATLKAALILNPVLPEAPQVREELVDLANLVTRGAAR